MGDRCRITLQRQAGVQNYNVAFHAYKAGVPHIFTTTEDLDVITNALDISAHGDCWGGVIDDGQYYYFVNDWNRLRKVDRVTGALVALGPTQVVDVSGTYNMTAWGNLICHPTDANHPYIYCWAKYSTGYYLPLKLNKSDLQIAFPDDNDYSWYDIGSTAMRNCYIRTNHLGQEVMGFYWNYPGNSADTIAELLLDDGNGHHLKTYGGWLYDNADSAGLAAKLMEFPAEIPTMGGGFGSPYSLHYDSVNERWVSCPGSAWDYYYGSLYRYELEALFRNPDDAAGPNDKGYVYSWELEVLDDASYAPEYEFSLKFPIRNGGIYMTAPNPVWADPGEGAYIGYFGHESDVCNGRVFTATQGGHIFKNNILTGVTERENGYLGLSTDLDEWVFGGPNANGQGEWGCGCLGCTPNGTFRSEP